MNVQVIHGPNINLTGLREPGQYGSETIDAINAQIKQYAEKLGMRCDIYQSNHEGDIIDRIHAASQGCDGIVLNAGAYTHYSYAIRDAIAAVPTPCVEVHFSNIAGRDEFRAKSVIAPVCVGSIAGFGKHSYFLALQALLLRREAQ